ncbi:hypothetical protein H6G81_23540 [Scytonema hofmannii FACHB-248]|uniref:Uncharacterized protein n=1 Tax=Scytonema hofmannii FACHB-248 TaxID=1842502 RepID=A0ABR8GW53_9CYAN|nr:MULTISPECIES: hypothetical protein [Nostocales]MBD2607417.1 hypothetical protein [Scytonema hofmannii FACHB-248]
MGTRVKQAEQNDGALLLRIKRAKKTDDGIVFAYLASQRQPQTDLACEAMRPYWLPLALKERGIKGKELSSVGLKAIAQLMQQIEVIRLECGLRPDEMPFGEGMRLPVGGVAAPITIPVAVPPPVPKADVAQYEGDEDEEDDGFWDSDLDDPIALADIEADAGFRL